MNTLRAYRDPRPSPRLPHVCVGWAGRAARALTTELSALALAAGALTLAPAPARAEDVITTQEYFSYYHLDTARAKGYTGKGVTIALIDGTVDTSAPELKGANIIDKSRCTIEGSGSGRSHGTAMASFLVAHDYGVAPTPRSTSIRFRTKVPSRRGPVKPADRSWIPLPSSSTGPLMTVPK